MLAETVPSYPQGGVTSVIWDAFIAGSGTFPHLRIIIESLQTSRPTQVSVSLVFPKSA